MAIKPSRSAIRVCLEQIGDAVKKGNVDAARRYREDIERAANLPAVWEGKKMAAALWRVYDLSGKWARATREVNARDVIDAVDAAIRVLNTSGTE